MGNKLNQVTITYLTNVSPSFPKSTKCLCQMFHNCTAISDASQTRTEINNYMKPSNMYDYVDAKVYIL